MSTTIVKTRDELLTWRESLLGRVRLSKDELFDRADAYTLSPQERNVYETIRSIDYLLDDE